jgi:osmoprotectant transport system ATP-binding protein
MDSAPEALIQFENVSYSVPRLAQPILADLSFTVARGETLILLGESGSGKTTTLRLINRLLLPTSGRVLVEGKATTELGCHSIAPPHRLRHSGSGPVSALFR